MSTTIAESLELRVVRVREYLHSIGVPADEIPDDRMAGVVGDFDRRWGEGWEGRLAYRLDIEFLDPRNPTERIAWDHIELRLSEMPRVWALIHAGWTYETLDTPWMDRDPHSWRWRRPPRRAGRPGRKFASTGRAYNAMMRGRGG